MIESIAHKGLKLFWEKDDATKLPAVYVEKIRAALKRLDAMTDLQEIRMLHHYRLHSLSGNLKDYWAISVSGNDRIIFKFINQNVYLLNYLDYH